MNNFVLPTTVSLETTEDYSLNSNLLEHTYVMNDAFNSVINSARKNSLDRSPVGRLTGQFRIRERSNERL